MRTLAMPNTDANDPARSARSQHHRHRLAMIATIVAAALAAGVALSGCGGLKRNPSGAITVTVKPGDTGTCAISPCRVLFEMPPGEREFQVRGNEVDFGRYPAGETVNLGDFYDPVAIEVVGAQVPKAYVYVPVYR
jgi:hypothetical protein